MLKLIGLSALVFATAIILAVVVQQNAGWMPYHGDGNAVQQQQSRQGLSIAIVAASLISGIAVLAAATLPRVHVPPYLGCCVVAFGLISLMPTWPSKSGGLLPLGAAYVNPPAALWKLELLIAHAVMTPLLAAAIVWIALPAARRIASTSREDEDC